jgi:hypothetical protein
MGYYKCAMCDQFTFARDVTCEGMDGEPREYQPVWVDYGCKSMFDALSEKGQVEAVIRAHTKGLSETRIKRIATTMLNR